MCLSALYAGRGRTSEEQNANARGIKSQGTLEARGIGTSLSAPPTRAGPSQKPTAPAPEPSTGGWESRARGEGVAAAGGSRRHR